MAATRAESAVCDCLVNVVMIIMDSISSSRNVNDAVKLQCGTELKSSSFTAGDCA